MNFLQMLLRIVIITSIAQPTFSSLDKRNIRNLIDLNHENTEQQSALQRYADPLYSDTKGGDVLARYLARTIKEKWAANEKRYHDKALYLINESYKSENHTHSGVKKFFRYQGQFMSQIFTARNPLDIERLVAVHAEFYYARQTIIGQYNYDQIISRHKQINNSILSKNREPK